MNSACWPDDEPIVTITAIGEALMAIDQELMKLEREDEQLMCRRKLIHEKQKILHVSMRKLLLDAGVHYTPRNWPHYPEFQTVD